MQPVTKSRNLEPMIRYYEGMGFSRQMILHAYEQCRGDESRILDYLFAMKYGFYYLSHLLVNK
jgi:hypothetical protein